MKKSLIALAVLAAAGAASAQSSVQIYGIADVFLGSATVKDGTGATVYKDTDGKQLTKTGVFSGGVSESRWGLKGSEDLGGGLKAVFTLEQGFNIDDGTSTGSVNTTAKTSATFSREASVGLQGGFGEVKAGKLWTAFDDVNGAAATVFNSALAPINALPAVGKVVGYKTAAMASINPNNGIKYTSPTVNGFTGSASYAFGEDKTATDAASKLYSFSGQYATGPLKVALGYAKATDFGDDSDTGNALRVSASYDLGVAVAKASFGRVKDTSPRNLGKTNDYELGADVPLSSNLTLAVGYGASKTKDGAGVLDTKANSFGLAVAYNLSKRTLTYAGLNNTKAKDGATGAVDAKVNVLAVGVNHSF